MASPAGVAAAPKHARNHTMECAENCSGSDFSASQTRDELYKENELEQTTTLTPVETSFEATGESGQLYGSNGQLRLMPAATQDPRDPINLPRGRKILGLLCVCCFGALAAAAELILGSMLPVFALQYAGIDPKILAVITATGGLPEGSDLFQYLEGLPNAPPIWETYLLGSMPILVMGIANLFLIPLAISVGRRAVILSCGLCAIIGAIWAGYSQSLPSHIGARCVQALGAGTVESLIPSIIQDMVHVHQRNTAISTVFAALGTVIIAIGIATPYMIINLSWRYVYYITAAGAGFFLIGTYLFMPETRWLLCAARHAEDIFLPQIFFITMLNSVMISAAVATAYMASPALLTAPWEWSFENLGLGLVPVLISAGFVAGLTGTVADWLTVADWVTNKFAKKRGKRTPENQIVNLIAPTVCSIIGTVLFGVAGGDQAKYLWDRFLVGLGLLTFGFLGKNTIGAVYLLEYHPQLAGQSALVNIASFRCLLAFILSFRVSQWVADLGYVKSMIIYTGLMAAFALLLPVVYYFGPS